MLNKEGPKIEPCGLHMLVVGLRNRLIKALATNVIIYSLSHTIINMLIIIITSFVDAEVFTEAGTTLSLLRAIVCTTTTSIFGYETWRRQRKQLDRNVWEHFTIDNAKIDDNIIDNMGLMHSLQWRGTEAPW